MTDQARTGPPIQGQLTPLSAIFLVDGESNGLEGGLLMLVYAILAISFEFTSPLG